MQLRRRTVSAVGREHAPCQVWTVELIVLGIEPKHGDTGRVPQCGDCIDQMIRRARLVGCGEAISTAVKIHGANDPRYVLCGNGHHREPPNGMTEQDDMLSVDPGLIAQ